jgi:ribonuclease HI
MRNFPHVGLYGIEHGEDSPEPQVQMQFALYVPKSCLEIVLEFPPPWRNICVSRKGVHYFPAAQCPEPTHFDIRARSPLSVACSRAREALRLAEQNRHAETQESQRLEYEADLGVPLNRFRNVSPSSLRYFQEASRHRPLHTTDDPVLSQHRLDAFNAKYDLPPFISWPVLLDNSSPFPWCCGACRFKRNAILLPTTTLITLPTPPICPCLIRDAKIVCNACSEVFCWECFTVVDDYFLSSLQHAPFPVSIRNYQGASRNFRNAMPACEFEPDLAAEADNFELQMAVLAGDADDIDGIQNADKVHSELPSQDLSEEVLLEARRGSSSLAAAALFSCAPTKRSRDGYVLNNFVSAALSPSPPQSPSSQSNSNNSDPTYVPSQEGLCPECLQPWPTASHPTSQSSNIAPLALTSQISKAIILSPHEPSTATKTDDVPPPLFSTISTTSMQTFFRSKASPKLLIENPVLLSRTFVPSPSKPMPELPKLTLAPSTRASTGTSLHNPICVDSPPREAILCSASSPSSASVSAALLAPLFASTPVLPLPTQGTHLAASPALMAPAMAAPLAAPILALVAPPIAVAAPVAIPIPALAPAPPLAIAVVAPAAILIPALAPAPPLVGIHPNPGPPPVSTRDVSIAFDYSHSGRLFDKSALSTTRAYAAVIRTPIILLVLPQITAAAEPFTTPTQHRSAAAFAHHLTHGFPQGSPLSQHAFGCIAYMDDSFMLTAPVLPTASAPLLPAVMVAPAAAPLPLKVSNHSANASRRPATGILPLAIVTAGENIIIQPSFFAYWHGLFTSIIQRYYSLDLDAFHAYHTQAILYTSAEWAPICMQGIVQGCLLSSLIAGYLALPAPQSLGAAAAALHPSCLSPTRLPYGPFNCPLYSALNTSIPAVVLTPAAPLICVHKHPGPIHSETSAIIATSTATSAFDDRFHLACISPFIGTSLPSFKISNHSTNASRRPIRGSFPAAAPAAPLIPVPMIIPAIPLVPFLPPAAPLIGVHPNPGPVTPTAPPLRSSTRTPCASLRAAPRAAMNPSALPNLNSHSDSSDDEDERSSTMRTPSHATRPSSALLPRRSARPHAPNPRFADAATLSTSSHLPSSVLTDHITSIIDRNDNVELHSTTAHAPPLTVNAGEGPVSGNDIAALLDFYNEIAAENPFSSQHNDPTPILAAPADDSVAALHRNAGSASARLLRQHSFPLAIRTAPISPIPSPQELFKFDCVQFTDGGSKDKIGSWSVLARHNTITTILSGHIPSDSTNNLAEFTAALQALIFAQKHSFKRLLIVTDSEVVANFLRGTSKISKAGLKKIAAQITECLATSSFEALFVSHVPAHSNACIENDIADALCTWNLQAKQEISHLRLCADASNLPALLFKLNAKRPCHIAELASTSNLLCALCLKSNCHNASSCPLAKFSRNFNARQLFPPCAGCLSREHANSSCPFLCFPRRLPSLSVLLPEPPFNPALLGPLQDLSLLDFDNLYFPRHQHHIQFLDYWTTTFASMLKADTVALAKTAAAAAEAWSLHYTIDGLSILSRQPRSNRLDARGSNLHPQPADPDFEMARRALKAARLGPDARISDISKALRKGAAIPLDDRIIDMLTRLYPQADEHAPPTLFEPLPIPRFAVNRHAVARAVMSRSPNSHPGKCGITFGILQLFCKLTYKKEKANNPDIRWTMFCNLIALIMSGNATALSPMFHTVVGIYFDKNADSQGSTLSLRNIGVEESLVRIAAALVFAEVVEDAVDRGFLSCWELGCGVKSGAEIFGRLAATAAEAGLLISVFDVEKAFNNLRRSDVKAAVEELNNPLLSAFVHYLFASDPTVTFRDNARFASFTLTVGILQGNPISTFLFSLTMRFILKPFRLQHPSSLTPNFVDDLLLIGKPTPAYPIMLAQFLQLFLSHGLKFDLSNTAKTSVFTKMPLPSVLNDEIIKLNIRVQCNGITPCKIPCGTVDFISEHVLKAANKFRRRALAFKALWPAMLKLKPLLKRTRIGIYEGYLNILRLSLLSMTNYTLRTVSPLYSAPYANLASSLSLELIEQIFPPMLNLIGHPLPTTTPAFPDLIAISRNILQLPLSLGGLSLRLPLSIHNIAYAASCGECVPYLKFMAERLEFDYNDALISDFSAVQATVTAQVQGFEILSPKDSISFARNDNSPPLQESLTTLLNFAEIVRIGSALKPHTILALAFKARVDKSQDHCSWAFNPAARLNLNIAALADEDFSRAIQVATLRPITLPRVCDCGGIIDPVGLHFLHCKLVHFGYLHDCVKHAIVATIRSFQQQDLAPLSVSKEVPVNRFYPLRYADRAEGVIIVADIAAMFEENSQQACLIADVSSVIARSFNASNDFQAPARARSKAKCLKYDKYDIPRHLFHPITVGRTNVLSADALNFCEFIGKFFPTTPMVVNKIKASISRAIVVGTARTLNTALRRAQLAAFNVLRFAQVPKSAACRLFEPSFLPINASGLNDSDTRSLIARVNPLLDSVPPCGPGARRVTDSDSLALGRAGGAVAVACGP